MMLPPDTKLLLDCLRNDPPDVKIRNLQVLKEKDWHVVLQQAMRYQMAPLLYSTLKNELPELEVPDEIFKQLKNAYYIAASRNMVLYRQLREILVEFNKNNIPVILLKGAHLAQFVYGNIALRLMSDIDLLAKKEDLGRASEVLINLGYKPSKDIGTSEVHVPPFRDKNKIKLELHFNIYSPPLTERLSVDDIWRRSNIVSLEGIDVSLLCPEDALIYICVHAAIDHGFDNGLKPFIDIKRIIEYYQGKLEWNKLLLIGRILRVSNCLYLMFASAKLFLGVSIPDYALNALRPADKNMINYAEELMFGKSSLINSHLSRLFGNEKLSVKMHYIIRRVFPRKETMICEGETSGSLFFYVQAYLTRFGYLFQQYGDKVFRALLKDQKIVNAIEHENKKNAVRDWLVS